MPDDLLSRADLEGNEKLLIMILGRLGALEKPVHPRQAWLAEKMGVREDTMNRMLKRLAKKGVLKFEGRIWKIQQYSLVITRPNAWSSPGQTPDDSPGQTPDHKRREQSRRRQIEEQPAAAPSAAGEDSQDIVEVFDAFRTSGLNPHINFGNRTQRSAAADLLKAYGLGKVLKTIAYAASVSGQRYAPTITSPLALKQDLGKLIAYSKKEQSKKPNIAFIS